MPLMKCTVATRRLFIVWAGPCCNSLKRQRMSSRKRFYELIKLGGVSIPAGVRNVFDEDFPAINLVAGRVLPFDPRRVDVRGRVAFIEIGKKFN